MSIYNNSKKVIAIYHNSNTIAKIMNKSVCVYSSLYDCYITSALPLIMEHCVGKDVIDYSVVGNICQDGEPTIDNPIDIVGVGERTNNLCPELILGIGIDTTTGEEKSVSRSRTSGFFPISFADNNKYVLSNMNPNYYNFIACYDANKNYLTRTSASMTSSRNISINNFQNYSSFDLSNNAKYFRVTTYTKTSGEWSDDPIYAMLNEGTTALPYEGYYKIPIISRGKNLFNMDDFVNGYHINGTSFLPVPYTSSESGRCCLIEPINITTDKYIINYKYDGSEYVAVLYSVLGENNEPIRRIAAVRKGGIIDTSDGVDDEGNTIKARYLYVCFYKTGLFVNVEDFDYVQVESGETVTSYEPYIEPTTSNIYLNNQLMQNETITNEGIRDVKWKKYVFTGEETIQGVSSFTATKAYQFRNDVTDYKPRNTFYCSHMKVNDKVTVSYTHGYAGQFVTLCFNLDLGLDTIEKVQEYLTAQYQSGTPLTIWYPLETSSTEEIYTPPTISTFKGTTVLDTDCYVKPSSMTVHYKSSQKDETLTQLISTLED